jgi:hypothetical protein
MKVKFLLTAAVICVLGFANAAKADTVSLSTGAFNWSAGSIGNWGTVFSAVEAEAYYYRWSGNTKGELQADNYNLSVKARSYKSDSIKERDTYEYRLLLMKDYLRDTLGRNVMTTDGVTGVLHGSSNSLVTHSSYHNGYGNSHNALGNIYGQKAELLKGDWTTSGLINAMQMYRNGSTLNNIITSSASATSESVDHNWIYNSATDTFTSNSTSTSTGIGDHKTGIYSFVKGFTYSSSEAFQYLNGWFSELGFFVGVFVNGIEVPAAYLTMSEDFADSRMIRNHDMEIDLAALYAAGILKNGNNNIAFTISTILPEYYGGNIYDGNDGLVAFASGLQLNTESMFVVDPPEPPPGGGETPEPATLLILGAGLVGLGIRKRLSTKK